MLFRSLVWYLFALSLLTFACSMYSIYIGSYISAFGYVLISGWMIHAGIRGRKIYLNEE